MKNLLLISGILLCVSCDLLNSTEDENVNPVASFEPLLSTVFSAGDTLDITISITPNEDQPYEYMLVDRDYRVNGNLVDFSMHDSIPLNSPLGTFDYQFFYIAEDSLEPGIEVEFEETLFFKNPDNSGFYIGYGVLGFPTITIE